MQEHGLIYDYTYSTNDAPLYTFGDPIPSPYIYDRRLEWQGELRGIDAPEREIADILVARILATAEAISARTRAKDNVV